MAEYKHFVAYINLITLNILYRFEIIVVLSGLDPEVLLSGGGGGAYACSGEPIGPMGHSFYSFFYIYKG